MAFYVWIAGTSRRRHKKEDGYMSIGYMDLEKGFGRGGFKTINEALNIFDVTANWSQLKKLTKGFKPTELVQLVKDKYLAQARPKITRLITLDGQAMRSLPEAVASKDLDEVTATAWKEAKPFNNIPVQLDKMKELQAHLERMPNKKTGDLFHDADIDDINYRIEIIGQLIRLAHTDVAGRGFIAHRYAEGRTGRLYARGISLQTAPRIIRKAALHGLYDYDIENCHYSIFYQLAQRAGIECVNIKHYLTNKSEVRKAVSANVSITLKQTKSCLLALMYGAKLSEWYENAIPDEIGQEKARALYADANFSGIAADVKAGGKLILEQWDKSKTMLFNDMGKSILLSEPSNKKMAHLLQGIEAKAIKAAIMLYPDDVVLLMHDGFVSKAILDLQMIEQVIYDETGFNLQVSYEPITVPPDLGL